jgi:hypothetical protein
MNDSRLPRELRSDALIRATTARPLTLPTSIENPQTPPPGGLLVFCRPHLSPSHTSSQSACVGAPRTLSSSDAYSVSLQCLASIRPGTTRVRSAVGSSPVLSRLHVDSRVRAHVSQYSDALHLASEAIFSGLRNRGTPRPIFYSAIRSSRQAWSIIDRLHARIIQLACSSKWQAVTH